MAVHSLSRTNLFTFLEKLQKDYSVFVPVKRGEQRFYRQLQTLTPPENGKPSSKRDQVVIGEVRAFEPLKVFFFRARETAAEGFSDVLPASSGKPSCIVGAKACDLKAFTVQDAVFLSEDYKDPLYIRQREESLVISADCTCAIETCFCLALKDKPFPEQSYDINISEIEDRYLVETGSRKGESLVGSHSSLFESASSEAVAERDAQRQRVIDEVKNNISEHEIPDRDLLKGVVERGFDAPLWKEEAETCVECGACNTICPTCHCFLLYDQLSGESMSRLRMWDSCMIKDFAKVAGGANPRSNLWMRLRNRFEKKFDFFPKTKDIYACTGCGRCITACPAKIDIRRVLKRLVENV